MQFFNIKKIAILIVLFILLTLFTSCEKDSETITLNLAHFFPSTHPAETEFVQGWISAIEEKTNGKIKIESYPGGTLLSAADTYNGVVEGVADIGLSCFAYTRGRFPVLEAFELPGIVYENSKVASMVAWDGINQLSPKEVQDTKLLMVIATGPGDLFTKVPVRNLNDLKGLEIRATGLSSKTIEALGGVAVGMPQSEAYEALSKSVVKGNLSPVEVLKGWKHGEVTDYITRTPFLYNTLFFVTMNKEKWDSIDEDIQKIILEETEKFHKNVGISLWDKQNEEAMTWAIDQEGMEEIFLTEEEKQLWIEKVLPIQNEYLDNIKDIDIDVDILKLINELADKYNDIY